MRVAVGIANAMSKTPVQLTENCMTGLQIVLGFPVKSPYDDGGDVMRQAISISFSMSSDPKIL